MPKSILKYLVLVCMLYGNIGMSQTFPPFNLALDDSCTHAPFFCEGALRSLSSNNMNGTANDMDSLTNCTMENTVWLSFTTCLDSVQIDFMVDSCSLGNGLEFTLFDTDDCINYSVIGDPCQVILNQTIESLSFNDLIPGQTYTLAIDGINGDFCSFAVDTTIGIFMPNIGSGPGSDWTLAVIEPAYIIPPDENCPKGEYQYVAQVCELQPSNCGGGSSQNTCDIEYDICKLDPGIYIFPSYIYTTSLHWYYPDCAIVTGDTTGNIVNIDISPCIAELVETMFLDSLLPPTPPFDPLVPVANFNFNYGVNTVTTVTLDSNNIDTIIITDGGITHCPECGTTSPYCDECDGNVDDNGNTPIYYCQEDIVVCPECSGDNCPNDFSYEIDGCKINAKLYVSSDPQNEYLGQFEICPGECLTFDGNTFCGEGYYTFPDIDSSGCEIEVSLDLVIFQFPPTIISISGDGDLLTCYNTCTTLEVQTFDVDFFDWGGAGGNTSIITVCSGGSYTCQVSNDCGFDQVSFTVFEDIFPPTIDLMASVPVLTIDMDSSELSVNHSGSGANLTYEWRHDNSSPIGYSNPITVTEPGTYNVIVTNQDNGCYTEAEIEIFENIVTLDETPIGSDCNSAPLFCSEFLDDFNTDNENGQPDTSLTALNCPVDNAIWLKFVACDSLATFSFEVDSCTQAQGLEFSVVSSDDCNNFSSSSSNCIPISNGAIDSISFDNLSADSIYYLVIDGIDGDICNLNIDALNGVMNSGYGDTLDPLDTINYRLELITPGIIDGPTEMCAFAPTTYTFIPGVCGYIEGDCNRAVGENSSRVFAEPCDLPFSYCFGGIETDTIVDWDIPDGITIIGDSTNFDITIEASLDWILEQYNGMIPASDTDTIVVTLYADYAIVPISDTLTSDSTEVYCNCPATGIICGGCNTGASLDVSIIIIFDSQTISECDPNCIDICDGQLLCPGGFVYCTEPCILTTWTLIEEPPQIDFYFEQVCAGECAQTPYGEFCAGTYFINIDPCLDVQIDIAEVSTLIVYPEEIICPGDCVNVGSMTFCAPGIETWTGMENGCTINYSVTILEFNTLPIDYGPTLLCEGECLDISGNTFCTPGVHSFVETSADGCNIDATVELIWESAALSIGPITELCNTAGDEYNVSFSIMGDPPFTVNGVEITGNFFTSEYYPDGDDYFFEVKNAQATCPAIEIVSGTYYCPLLNCDSDPGSLIIKEEIFCISSELTTEEIDPVFISSDDFTSEYVLHEGYDPFSNPVLMRNDHGIFTYDNSLDYGTQYSVSRIVGEKMDGINQVDFNGNCLDFAAGPKVTFFPEPILAISPSETILLNCNQSEVNINALASGGSDSFTINWTSQGTTSSGNSITAHQAGSILVELVDNLTSCQVIQSIEVDANFEAPQFTLTAPEVLNCIVPEVAVIANIDDMTDILTLDWSSPLGTLPLGANPAIIQTETAGWHYLNITNEENGCNAIDSIQVMENENLPTAIEFSIQQPICGEEPYGNLIIENVQGGNEPFDYYLDGMEISNTIDHLHAGIYELEVVDQFGCTLIEEIEIIEPSELLSNMAAEITIDFGEEIQLDPNLNFTPNSIVWQDDHNEHLGNTELLHISISENKRIRFIAFDENGCSIEKTIRILVRAVNAEIYAPSAFSPNGDQVNDAYELFAQAQVTKIDQLVIFDRWGGLVFKAENYLPGDGVGKWNGKLNGKSLNPGVFIYSAQYTLMNGKQMTKVGDLVLLK